MGYNGLGGGSSRVGIVTGLIEEAQAFRPAVGTFDGDCPFYCRRDRDVIIACAGIGKVNAAIAASHLIRQGADLLVSMGVAGALRGTKAATYWIRDAVQSDYGAFREGAFNHYRAGVLPFGTQELDAYRAIAMDDHGLPEARILTGDCFMEDAVEADRLAAHLDGDLIDMETGALAQVAAMANLGWAGIRTVSDAAGEGSAADFEANLSTAARASANATERFLSLWKTRQDTADRASATVRRQRENSDLPGG